MVLDLGRKGKHGTEPSPDRGWHRQVTAIGNNDNKDANVLIYFL